MLTTTRDMSKALAMLIILCRKFDLKFCLWIMAIRDVLRSLHTSAVVVAPNATDPNSGRQLGEEEIMLVNSFFDVFTELSMPGMMPADPQEDPASPTVPKTVETEIVSLNLAGKCAMHMHKIQHATSYKFGGVDYPNDPISGTNLRPIIICIHIWGRDWGIRIYIHLGVNTTTTGEALHRGAILDSVTWTPVP